MLTALIWLAGSALAPSRPPAERLAAGCLGLLTAAWAVMAQPLVGASLLAHPWLLRFAGVGTVAGLLAWRRPPLVPPRPPLRRSLAVLAVLALAAAVAYPAWRTPSDQLPGSDLAWHQGWIRQLATGLTEPGGVYDGVPNAYPWLLHALAAIVMQAFGTGLASALLVVEGLMLLMLGLGAWLLARELRLSEPAAGWASALAIGGGGIGWLWTQAPAAVLTVGRAGGAVPAPLRPFRTGIGAYGGDFLLSPAPTPALGNIPPAEPRDFGLALLPLALWLFVRGLRRGSWRIAAASGLAMGFVMLTSPVAAVVGVVCLLALALVFRSPLVGAALAGAAATVLIWFGPLAWHYHQLGGFVRTSHINGLSPTLAQAAVATAVLLGLAAVGLAAAARGGGLVDFRVLLPMLIVAAAFYLGSNLLGSAGGALPAFGRSVRYLPVLALVLVFPAGLGAHLLVRSARRFWPAAAAVIAAAAFGSVLIAAAGVNRAVAANARVPVVDCDGPVPLTGHDTVLLGHAPGQGKTAFQAAALALFADTGAHLLYVPRPRIRYAGVERSTPSQAARKAGNDSVSAGGVPPAGVTAVLLPEGVTAPSGLQPVATCTIQPYAHGHYVTTRYTLYGVADPVRA